MKVWHPFIQTDSIQFNCNWMEIDLIQFNVITFTEYYESCDGLIFKSINKTIQLPRYI